MKARTVADAAQLDNESTATIFCSVAVFPCAVTGSPPGTGEAPNKSPRGFSINAHLAFNGDASLYIDGPGRAAIRRSLIRKPRPSKEKPRLSLGANKGTRPAMDLLGWLWNGGTRTSSLNSETSARFQKKPGNHRRLKARPPLARVHNPPEFARLKRTEPERRGRETRLSQVTRRWARARFDVRRGSDCRASCDMRSSCPFPSG